MSDFFIGGRKVVIPEDYAEKRRKLEHLTNKDRAVLKRIAKTHEKWDTAQEEWKRYHTKPGHVVPEPSAVNRGTNAKTQFEIYRLIHSIAKKSKS